MQPSSLLGTGPLQGMTSVTACLSSSPQMPFQDPNQHQQQQQQQQHFTSQLDQHSSQPQHNMDDFLEQMFSMSNWSEVAGAKVPWEYNSNASTASNNSTPNNQKLFTMSLLPGQALGSQESEDPSRDTNQQLQYSYDESLLASRLRQHQLSGNPVINSSESNTSPGRSMVLQLSTGNPSHLLASLGNSPRANANTGCEGGMLPLPLTLGQGKQPDINDPLSRDDIEGTFKSAGNNVRDSNPGGGIFPAFVGSARPVRPAAPSFHSQAGQVPMQSYGGMPQTQPQSQSQHPPQNPVGAPPARPRVRARRGQATDPHSIAERLRRERIAERMKALQELVPNANKTDKASMLDEIIEYVKFLQLQVKVLSMSRLGGAGAVAPLVADIPSEGSNNSQAAALARANGGQGSSQDGLAMTERQVAKLMEDDMGTAMQYLQSKGLCLMPISLASAISSSGSRPGAPNHSLQGLLASSNALEPTNSALSAITSVSMQPSIGSPASGITETDNANKSGNGSTRNPKDSREANSMIKSNGIGPKLEDEPQRRTPQ